MTGALASAAKILLGAGTGALGTLLPDGHPCVTLVSVATHEGRPLLLLSRLALHTRNLARSPKASLLLREEATPAPDGDILAGGRLTLVGDIARTDAEGTRDAFLRAHPQAADYVDFADFGFHAMEIERAHLVAGFGRIVEIAGDDLRAALR